MITFKLTKYQINDLLPYCKFKRSYKDVPLLAKYQDNKAEYNQFLEINLVTNMALVDRYYMKITSPVYKILFN